MILLVARPAVECSADSAPCASPPCNRLVGANCSRFPATHLRDSSATGDSRSAILRCLPLRETLRALRRAGAVPGGRVGSRRVRPITLRRDNRSRGSISPPDAGGGI